MLVGLAGQMIIPIVGASWIYTWFKSYRTRQDSIRRINSGNIADYLDEDDRISFEQDMKALETVAAAVVSAEPTAPAPTEPNLMDRAIADFQEAAPIISAGPAATVINNAPTDARNLLEVVAENPKSSFFSAPARTGKGVTIAGCIRMVQNRAKVGKLKGVTFWAMTPKQDPKENWYWETCDQFFNPNIETGDRLLAARGIYQFINEFGKLPRSPETPTILVVDELTRLIGLLKGIKMVDVDPELFAHDSKTFADWLVDKLIYSASMSQSVGYYIWVATPSNAISNRGFAKGDVGSLNLFTLATKDNLKFADGGTAAFSAPKTDSNHPVFARGFVAGYCHQSQRWYAVPDLSRQVKGRSAVPVKLQNVWIPGSFPAMQDASVLTKTELPDDEDGKLNLEKPNLPRSELLLIAAELAEWIAQHPELNRKDWCSRWNAHKRGFSRPQFRYLLTLIEE
jgi:hypothetical protein